MSKEILMGANAVNLWLNHQHILQDISLSIHQHDFITIIGPNGAGKSLLLKCLMGIYKPTTGDIYKKNDLIIGYVPQRLSIPATIPMTVFHFLNLHKQSDLTPIEQIAAETNIESILKKSLHHLSTGQLQRVALARALLKKPDLLILDEPEQNLDIKSQLHLYTLLENCYKNHHFTLLMASHNLHFVMRCSTQIICLFQHICCQGKAKLVAQNPAFLSLFGDDMARMMTVYHHDHAQKANPNDNDYG